MKYNQPFDQPSNPNAPYIDGNPAAGIQGSIVPAAAVEYPQREIVNTIQAAGLTGTNADLNQLLEALKIVDVFNHFKLGTNSGNASQWSCTIPTLPIMPPPRGCTIWFEPMLASVNGGTVFSVNGSAFAPVKMTDGSDIAIGDVAGPGWLLLFFDGTNWVILAGSTRVPSSSTGGGGTPPPGGGTIPALQKNADWYVNGTTGDDTYDGTSATFISAKVGPFKTLQRAANEVPKYNMNGYNQNIHVADGNYGPVIFGSLNGAGECYVIGNANAPQNCTITGNTSVVPYCAIAQYAEGSSYDYTGFRLSTPASGGYDGFAGNGGYATLHTMRFGPCGRYHISCNQDGATVDLETGTIFIEPGANAVAHISAEQLGFVTHSPNLPTLNILGTVTFTNGFIQADHLGYAQMQYTSITNPQYVTGPKFAVWMNGVVSSLHGVNYYPGSAAGTQNTGGQVD
jgi:hypothetical protein